MVENKKQLENFNINSLKKKLDINFLISYLFFDERNKEILSKINSQNYKQSLDLIKNNDFDEDNFKEYIHSLEYKSSFMISKENKFIDYGTNNDLFSIDKGANKGDKAYKDIYDLIAFDIDKDLNLSFSNNKMPFKQVQEMFLMIYQSEAFQSFEKNIECQNLLKNIKKMGGEYSKEKILEHKNNFQEISKSNEKVLLKEKNENYLNSYFFRKNEGSKFLLKMKDLVFDKNGATFIPLTKLIPDAENKNEITGYQMIPKFGDKIFQGSPTGSCFIFNKQEDSYLNKIDANKKKIYLSEGMATAVSIFKMLDEKEQVICAFNSGNLKQIYKDILSNEKFKNHEVVICIDIDSPIVKKESKEFKLGAGWNSLFELLELNNNSKTNPYNIQASVSKPIFPELFRNDTIIYSTLENDIYSGKDLLKGSFSDFNDIENEFKNSDQYDLILNNNKKSLLEPVCLNEDIIKIVDSPIIIVNDIGDEKVNNLKDIVVRNNHNFDIINHIYNDELNSKNFDQLLNEKYGENSNKMKQQFLNSNEHKIIKEIFKNDIDTEVLIAKTKFLIKTMFDSKTNLRDGIKKTIHQNILNKKIQVAKIKKNDQDLDF